MGHDRLRETVNLRSTNLLCLMVLFYISSKYWKRTFAKSIPSYGNDKSVLTVTVIICKIEFKLWLQISRSIIA
jgi:hypothetical protein